MLSGLLSLVEGSWTSEYLEKSFHFGTALGPVQLRPIQKIAVNHNCSMLDFFFSYREEFPPMFSVTR